VNNTVIFPAGGSINLDIADLYLNLDWIEDLLPALAKAGLNRRW